MKNFSWGVVLALFMLAGSALLAQDPESPTGGGKMKLTSPVFGNNALMPAKYTCEGEDVNPPLEIQGIPQGTQTLALIVDDPDAPMGTWVHWVVFNIEPASRIEENTSPGLEGRTNFGTNAYGGPCPPTGTHRYFFKLFALDASIDAPAGISKGQLEKAMQGHILGSAELIGLYKKTGKLF